MLYIERMHKNEGHGMPDIYKLRELLTAVEVLQ